MTNNDLIHLSLEQTVEQIGDPVARIFSLMYERFPDLLAYKEENPEWENYMFDEIIANFMQFGEDPETAMMTIRDMAVHHELIGVPREIFSGLYEAMYEVMRKNFYGPQQSAMDSMWQSQINRIQKGIQEAV